MPKILQNHYVLAVHNVRESARFYVDVLDFAITSDLGGWIFVSKDNCMIMLGECPNDMHPSQLGCHNYFAYLRVDDVDAYHARIQRNGLASLHTVADKPWGMREFGITTPDGIESRSAKTSANPPPYNPPLQRTRQRYTSLATERRARASAAAAQRHYVIRHGASRSHEHHAGRHCHPDRRRGDPGGRPAAQATIAG
jgi:predicted enzyme related to lactoylglutathione lyase